MVFHRRAILYSREDAFWCFAHLMLTAVKTSIFCNKRNSLRKTPRAEEAKLRGRRVFRRHRRVVLRLGSCEKLGARLTRKRLVREGAHANWGREV